MSQKLSNTLESPSTLTTGGEIGCNCSSGSWGSGGGSGGGDSDGASDKFGGSSGRGSSCGGGGSSCGGGSSSGIGRDSSGAKAGGIAWGTDDVAATAVVIVSVCERSI